MAYDSDLGNRVAALMVETGIETPMKTTIRDSQLIKASHLDIMQDGLGLDMGDDSLKDTPARVAKMYCEEIFTGLDYSLFPKCTTVENKMRHDELVIVNADILSMCEHHFVPFIGEAHVAYIPNTKVLGLSKIPRVVDFFSRRPQIQERLTAQVHTALCYILETQDVAVTMKAEHMCMRLRGVQQQGKSTITSKMSGKFMDKPALREEFLMLTRSK
jgi:GTP cyclohydrolase I